ncbi:MAG: GTPase domain-containing protein [Planctomycetota bacterium]
MKTRLSDFCRTFDTIIRPLVAPVEHVVSQLGDGGGPQPLYDGLPALREGHHRLKLLMEKIQQQQAYVLIFGPLKSGKSTLMNAITAAYVSEVTSLPAYPCLVYVSHSPRPEFLITRYDGSSESLSTSAELHQRFTRAHQELSDQLRAFEEQRSRGGSPPSYSADDDHFDPAVHFPQAIRKVDVKVPAGDLEESGAVLVDTPGLYCRMKFGYAQMTRDFRDTAACAVFVVKTDNLFLEQVFEEFQELLELFGRIALVVNLDSTKCDLGPDGSLVPSLERENPQQIIEAFESLAMSAPLKAALDQGRLRIYPVDLLRAASERLRGAEGLENDPEIVHTGFEAFRRDMTEYLASDEYFEAFRLDSLRYAEALFERLAECSRNEDVLSIRGQVDQLRTLTSQGEGLSASLRRTIEREWKTAFAGTSNELDQELDEFAREIVRRLLQSVSTEVDEWFGNEHSLEDLAKVGAARLLHHAQEEMANHVAHVLAERAQQRDANTRGGFSLDERTTSDLARADLALEPLLTGAAQRVDTRAEVDPLIPSFVVDAIPVRKGLSDWLTFRSKASVRQRLFGERNHPAKPIPVSSKTKQIGSAGRLFLLSSLEDFVRDKLPRRLQQIARSSVDQYVDHFTTPLVEAAKRKQREVDSQLERDRERWETLRGIAESFARLDERLEVSQNELRLLRETFAKTEVLEEPRPHDEHESEGQVEAV